MNKSSSGDITQLLIDWGDGDEDALMKLMPRVYDELRRTAAGYLRNERPDHTLQPTALVNETYLRLVQQKQVSWQNRVHFFALSAQMMRRILVDHARNRGYLKRGGGVGTLTLEEVGDVVAQGDAALLDLHEALGALEVHSKEHSRIVELRQFGGLSQGEIAEVLGLSLPTVARRWRVAKTWLFRYLHHGESGEL